MFVLFDTPGGTGQYMARRHSSMVHNGLHIETVTQLLRTTISEGRFTQHVSVARKILQQIHLTISSKNDLPPAPSIPLAQLHTYGQAPSATLHHRLFQQL